MPPADAVADHESRGAGNRDFSDAKTEAALARGYARKKVEATAGTHIFVRFLCARDCTADDRDGRQPAFSGYKKGVRRGTDLPGSFVYDAGF